MSVSCCTLSLMGSFICKGLELISIIPSLIQLSLQIKVNQMLQSEISVPCQLLTSPVACRARQTLMLCIYLPLPRCNLNFCTCPGIPGKRGVLLGSKSFIPVPPVWFCHRLRFLFFPAKTARWFNPFLRRVYEERLCLLNCICCPSSAFPYRMRATHLNCQFIYLFAHLLCLPLAC